MESIILTIIITFGVSSPAQILEEAAKDFRDPAKTQLYLDTLAGMDLTDSEKARYHHYQGYVHSQNNDIARAIVNYRESIRYYEALEAKAPGKNTEDHFYYRISSAYQGLGNLYYHYNSPEMAMDEYEKALKYTPPKYLPGAYYNIALAQNKMGNTEIAVDYSLNSFKLSVEHGDDEFRIKSQIFLGTLLQQSKNYEASLEHLNTALLDDSLTIALETQARNILGITTWMLKDYGSAEHNFNYVVENGNRYYQFIGLLNLCEMNLEQGFVYKSIEVGTKAETQYADLITNLDRAKLYSYISDAYAELNDIKMALEYSNKYRDFTVSFNEKQQAIIDVGQANQIKAVVDNYESELKAAEDRKKSIQANIVVSSIILISFITLIWQQQSKKKKLVKEIENVLLS
ncbi:MAG: tetratricopeptide repeat protein [Bacteroidota bacterium]